MTREKALESALAALSWFAHGGNDDAEEAYRVVSKIYSSIVKQRAMCELRRKIKLKHKKGG